MWPRHRYVLIRVSEFKIYPRCVRLAADWQHLTLLTNSSRSAQLNTMWLLCAKWASPLTSMSDSSPTLYFLPLLLSSKSIDDKMSNMLVSACTAQHALLSAGWAGVKATGDSICYTCPDRNTNDRFMLSYRENRWDSLSKSKPVLLIFNLTFSISQCESRRQQILQY